MSSMIRTQASYIAADLTQRKTVTVLSGGTVYYKSTSDVTASSKDGEIASGSSATFTAGQWVVSASTSKVSVVDSPSGNVATGALPGVYAGQWAPIAATSGTDATPAEKKLYITSLFLPANKKVKGIGYQIGSVGGTNKVVAGLYNGSGTLLAKTSETTEGTLVGTAANSQEIDLTSEYQANGPGVYFIGITMNGNTARYRAIPANTAGKNILTGEITLTAKNTLESTLAAPATFTGDKGPVGWIY